MTNSLLADCCSKYLFTVSSFLKPYLSNQWSRWPDVCPLLSVMWLFICGWCDVMTVLYSQNGDMTRYLSTSIYNVVFHLWLIWCHDCAIFSKWWHDQLSVHFYIQCGSSSVVDVMSWLCCILRMVAWPVICPPLSTTWLFICGWYDIVTVLYSQNGGMTSCLSTSVCTVAPSFVVDVTSWMCYILRLVAARKSAVFWSIMKLKASFLHLSFIEILSCSLADLVLVTDWRWAACHIHTQHTHYYTHTHHPPTHSHISTEKKAYWEPSNKPKLNTSTTLSTSSPLTWVH